MPGDGIGSFDQMDDAAGPVFDQCFLWDGHAVRWACTGEGPPVVLCHGTPWSSFVWRTTAHRLAPERTVYMWDMLGYGQSDKPDVDVSLRTQARILAALLDEWDLQDVDLVAHDYGGAVALRAHLLHGASVRSLLLADVVALSPWGSPFFRLVGENPDVFERLPENLHRALVGEYVSGAAFGPLSPSVHEALIEPWLGPAGQAAFYRQIAQADQRYTDEVEHLYGEIGVPTLIIWGAEDTWIPVDRAHRLHEMIPDSRLEVIEAAGHLVQEDQPKGFVSLVADWLSS